MEELKVMCIVCHLHRRVCAQPFFREAIGSIVSDIILLDLLLIIHTTEITNECLIVYWTSCRFCRNFLNNCAESFGVLSCVS
jgi:hypothetical protein